MHAAALIHGIGSIGLFSSRAFLPAFFTAVVLRFGPNLPWVGDWGLLNSIEGDPTWFTSNWSLLILGLLSGLELLATKNADARALLDEVDKYLKTGMAALTSLGMISMLDARFVQQAIEQAGFFDYLTTFVVIPGVYIASSARSEVMQILTDADEDDDIGVQGLISWAEDIWSTFGILLLILFPIIMLIIIGLTTALILAARKYIEYCEEKSKIQCSQCKTMIYPCAIACPQCGTKVDAPKTIGFLGGSKKKPAGDIERHTYRLVEKKRCPVCASRFEERKVKQTCKACSYELMAEAKFAKQYMRHIRNRLPMVLGISTLFSLIPVVGLIPGVVYYRMALVAPFRRYLPFGKRLMLKWGIRILFFFLIMFQWIPLAGGAVVPIMALVNYTAYRGIYQNAITKN